MGPTRKKKSASNEIKKSPGLSRQRTKARDVDSNAKPQDRTKPKSTFICSPEINSTNLRCDSNLVKTSDDAKRIVCKKMEHQIETRESMQEAGPSVDEMNVQQLLALGEQSQVQLRSVNADDVFQALTDSDSDFEEVKSANGNEPIIPKDGVDITLCVPDMFNKHKKKGFDLAAHLKKQMNRVKKDLQLLMHKVHVLCWIAHLQFVNNTLNNPSLLSSCMSLVKSKNLYPAKYADLTYLEGILQWFHKNIELKKDFVDPLCTGGLLNEIKYQIEKKQAFTSKAFIFIFVILLRVLGLKARIVMSFQVLPVKPSLLESYGDVIKARSEKLSKSKVGVINKKNYNLDLLLKDTIESKGLRSKKRKSNEGMVDQKKKKKGKIKKNYDAQDETGKRGDNEFESEHFKPSFKLTDLKGQKKSKLKADYMDPNSKISGRHSATDVTEVEKIINDYGDEDKDFRPTSLVKTNTKMINHKKANLENEENVKKKEGSDVWSEVYLEAEEKWFCVDVSRQKVHCISEIYSRATHPVAYIVACNNDSSLKDVTKRYVPRWHSDTRKRRVDENWWDETMAHFLPPRTPQDKEEDEDINRQLLDQPLPSSIAEFKDHPMYVLRRHLLKFEAIYPPDAPTLGFVRGEPVYARECVFTLHSREMWYKQARLVRLKEEPYKIVKARPKYDKITGEIKKDLPLELFGMWQTEDYIPPIAINGKVPRNEYGNVDLFKPCMLPIGTVHLQIPALNKVAKKLDIDCAPATVGFDFHSGGSHPVFDGFVVCEEFRDILLDAWNKEVDESSKREEGKKEKRVYGNWRRLIRGLLIREKLKIKYAFGENSMEEDQ